MKAYRIELTRSLCHNQPCHPFCAACLVKWKIHFHFFHFGASENHNCQLSSELVSHARDSHLQGLRENIGTWTTSFGIGPQQLETEPDVCVLLHSPDLECAFQKPGATHSPTVAHHLLIPLTPESELPIL